MHEDVELECPQCGAVHEITVHDPEPRMSLRHEVLRMTFAWIHAQAEITSALCDDILAQIVMRGKKSLAAKTEAETPAPVERQGLTR